jgi:hypothetical protein
MPCMTPLPLRLALLGIDPEIAALTTASMRAGDAVVSLHDIAVEGSPYRRLAATADRAGRPLPPVDAIPWETLLDAASADAVLVGGEGWNDSRAESVRMLVQAGRPLVLGHPLSLSMLWAYEIDMIRADSGGLILPCLSDRLHPLVAWLRQTIEAALSGAAPLGGVEMLSCLRRQADRSREAVLRQFARDADLIRMLVGDPARLSTLGGGGDAGWSRLAVELSGPDRIPVRWQVDRGDAPSLAVTLVCESGSIQLDMTDGGDASLTMPGGEASQFLPAPQPCDDGGAILDLLRRRLGRAAPTAARKDDVLIGPAEWADAARAIELAETVPRSLARGRAIDLHQEEFSELGTFRGTMASLGCGIVLLGLLVIVLATLVGGIAHETGWGFGEQLAGLWPWIMLVTLVLFLSLQLLPLLLPPSASKPPSDPARPA